MGMDKKFNRFEHKYFFSLLGWVFYWTFKTKNPRKLLFEKKVLCKLDYIHLKCNWLANF